MLEIVFVSVYMEAEHRKQAMWAFINICCWSVNSCATYSKMSSWKHWGWKRFLPPLISRGTFSLNLFTFKSGILAINVYRLSPLLDMKFLEERFPDSYMQHTSSQELANNGNNNKVQWNYFNGTKNHFLTELISKLISICFFLTSPTFQCPTKLNYIRRHMFHNIFLQYDLFNNCI